MDANLSSRKVTTLPERNKDHIFSSASRDLKDFTIGLLCRISEQFDRN
jgi:hypothetical protein